MVRKFFVEGPNKGREFIRGAHPDDTRSIERLKRLRASRPYLHAAAARIPKEVADKTGLTSIETASSYSVRRLMFGRVPSSPPPPRARHHCYKCRSTNKMKTRIKRVKFERVGKIERRLSGFSKVSSNVPLKCNFTTVVTYSHHPSFAAFQAAVTGCTTFAGFTTPKNSRTCTGVQRERIQG
ncbi:hypothetical protein ALC56_08302 [Trachymyrmex septentrionalis]|uniref:Uncharacterized protein n=1 Tax=Trachymyrmex septentrionalis TaxID=34720 RepID=A0A151JV35_9HYME|nr:hypothetical protein ALC56_08302 [Trachymyrmex septentrionalis]